MALNTTVLSGYTADKQTYWDKRWLERSIYNCNYYDLAQRKVLPLNSGKLAYFTRYLPLSTRTTAVTETTTGGIASGSGQSFQNMSVTATVALLGNMAEISHLDWLVSLDKSMGEKIDIMGDQARETIDELCRNEFATYCSRVLADGSSTYSLESASTAAGAATTVVDSTITGGANFDADDEPIGATITILDRTNLAYGETRIVSDYTAATGTFTVSAAFSTAPGSGCRYRLVDTAALDAATTAEKMCHVGLACARRQLDNQLAMRFPNGQFACLIDPDQQFDLIADTTVTGLAQQSQPDMLKKGVIANWMGFELRQQSLNFREAVGAAGTYSATGVVHLAACFGQHALGVIELNDGRQKVYVKHPDELGQPAPRFHTISWQVDGFVAKMLNGCYAVGLATSASS